MPLFYYKAKITPHQIKTGKMEADSAATVSSRLKQMNYYPLIINPINVKKTFFTKAKIGLSIGYKDIALIIRQLANLIEAGLPIIRAIQTLINQIENDTLRNLLEEVKNDIQKGMVLSQALSKYPRYFSVLDTNIIRAGETAGNLDQVLGELADLKEEHLNLRAKILTAIAYPLLLLIVGFITVFILISFVLPRFVVIFEDLGELMPLPTKIVLGISSFFSKNWLVFIIAGVISFVILNRYFSSPRGRIYKDMTKLKLPVIGPLICELETARFAKTLAVLLKNGIPIVQALKIVSTIMENSIIAKQVDNCEELLLRGERLSAAIKNNPYFSPVVKNMISVGEESGRLEALLLKVDEHIGRETDRKIDIIVRLIEPVMILIMGIVIGTIVIAMLLPIFQLDVLIG